MTKAGRHWVRVDRSVRNCIKLHGLSAQDRWDWLELLTIAGDEGRGGRLPAINHIAFELRLSVPDTIELIKRLEGAKLVDRVRGGPQSSQSNSSPRNPSEERTPEREGHGGTFAPPNDSYNVTTNGWEFAMHHWGDWQYESDSSTERSKRSKERSRQRSGEQPHNRLPSGADKESSKESAGSNGSKSDPTIDEKTGRPLTADQWNTRLRVGRDRQAWPKKWGPMPGRPGCLVPAGAGLSSEDGKLWDDWDEMVARNADVREARGFTRNG